MEMMTFVWYLFFFFSQIEIFVIKGSESPIEKQTKAHGNGQKNQTTTRVQDPSTNTRWNQNGAPPPRGQTLRLRRHPRFETSPGDQPSIHPTELTDSTPAPPQPTSTQVNCIPNRQDQTHIKHDLRRFMRTVYHWPNTPDIHESFQVRDQEAEELWNFENQTTQRKKIQKELQRLTLKEKTRTEKNDTNWVTAFREQEPAMTVLTEPPSPRNKGRRS